MTKHGAVHTELVSLGFDIPSYDCTPVQHPGQPLSWTVVATLRCRSLNNAGELVMEAEGPSKPAACSDAAVQLLEAVRCLLPPQREEHRLRRGFVHPKPVAMFTSGEAKEAKSLVRRYGHEFLEAAVKYYLEAGTIGGLEPEAEPRASARAPSPPNLKTTARAKAPPPSPPGLPSFYSVVPPAGRNFSDLCTIQGNNSTCPCCGD